MRTTLMIDDVLMRRAKQFAARKGMTLSALVEQALREALHERQASPGPFRMPIHGEPGAAASHEPTDFAEALLEEDSDSLRRG